MRLNVYVAKDKEGEEVFVIAHTWVVDADGLKFSLDGRIVFWLTVWQHFRELEEEETKIILKRYLTNQE